MNTNELLVIGIMTGNSLDGADLTLTTFNLDRTILDIANHYARYSDDLKEAFRRLRETVNKAEGDMLLAEKLYDEFYAEEKIPSFSLLMEQYVDFLAFQVRELIDKARDIQKIAPEQKVDLIGLHGQTCAHMPPSMAISKNIEASYTVQVGDGQSLADKTGITVVYDFRSDDLMNGGEGAPLAPLHHMNLAECVKDKGYFPIAFFNGGNTGNISIVTSARGNLEMKVIGWDFGPFNHFPDLLMRQEKGLECDFDGQYGFKGTVNLSLLRLLYEKAALTINGENFLLKSSPKSSDPRWYNSLQELLGKAPVDGKILSFEDRLRTAEYFSAYHSFLGLDFLPEDLMMPPHFALCGGGWRNPVIKKHFIDLLMASDLKNSPILPEHQERYDRLRVRFNSFSSPLICEMSSFFGFCETAMEARIFADAAFSRIIKRPFTLPITTGAKSPTVCGIIAFPKGDQNLATDTLKNFIEKFDSLSLINEPKIGYDPRWSRASAGWMKRYAATNI
ncbi:MAG TPA: anhydro-N-acetylmuramic acid kinase [Oligoflexia bacterium]|nr:anhydro-N-acetylmuramic acid kinase [Oligoflexia bacterium]HMP27410.1 anhydro-N-acetylmuramic acid kinase [Oligoflexia bacterium]